MREIKFRAWDKQTKSMLLGLAQPSAVNLLDLTLINEKYPLMQYTGLKDKNGVEIFEGDIVTFWHDDEPLEECEKFTVQWFDHWARFDVVEPHSINEMPHDPEGLEVIGNIYETVDKN